MTLPQLPVISVKGKPFDCGQQYGTQVREQIRGNVDLYFEMWHTLWGVTRPEILKQCRELIPVIGNYDADILEELEGVARGTDLALEEIIAVNARYEINFARGIAPKQGGDGCTAAALPQITQNGHTLLGQNWDWLTRFQKMNLILSVQQPGKPGVVTQPEAGVLAHRGMNSAGLGVCFNGMSSNRDKFESKAPPFLIMMRGILNAPTFSRALEAVLSARATLSGNFLIAQRGGEAIDLEVSPGDVGFLYPDGGILTHSNHFLTITNREDFADVLKRLYPDTLFRAHRAQQLLESAKGHIEVNNFEQVFQDHFSYPHSICRHADTRVTGIKQWATLFSMVMDLDEPAIYVAEGNPCQNSYYQLTPSSLHQD